MVVRPVICRPFVGRREELAYLEERRREAAGSHGGVVLLAGDAGIGKSRLIAELCGPLATSRWRIGRGACLEHAQRPYGPVLDALAALDRGAASLTPAATKREQLDAIVERFARISAQHAVLAVVEDIHWGDTATLELLAFLAPRLERMRMLLIASFRPDELAPEHPSFAALANVLRTPRAGRIDLAPLGPSELEIFIDAALDGFELPEATRRAVARTSEGNPFFTEELLKSAVERGMSPHHRTEQHALPVSIRATLLERIRPLREEDRRIVALAAVIGRSFDLDLLAHTLGIPAASVLPALQRARAVQLLEETAPARFSFRHALTRETIYGDFLAAQLGPLHRRIALALEARREEPPLDDLAYHWWAAGDDDRSPLWNERAGDAAAEVHAHDDAVAFYARALETAALAPDRRAALIEKIAYRYGALGRADASRDAFSRAADLFASAAEHEGEARCRVRAAITAYTLGAADATAPLEAMLERLAPGAYLARSRVQLGLAWLAATFWYPTRASSHLERVDPRAIAAADDIALRYHNVAAWVAMTLGDLDTFRREHERWVAAAREAGPIGAVASAHYNGAACYATFALHDEAFEQIERALALARSERSRHAEESALAISAYCALMSGDLPRARDALRSIPPSTENQVTAAHGAAWGTLAGIHLGDTALAGTWFDGVDPALHASPESSCGAGFAEVLMRRGRPEEARAVRHRAIPDCERVRGNLFTLLAAARYGAPDDVVRARAQLATAGEAPTELPERCALELFDAYAARREGRHADAPAHARAAADGFRRLRVPLLEAAAREAAGETDAALAIYRRCGADADVRRLSGPPAAPPHRPRSHSPGAEREVSTTGRGGDVLSAREREIATRVAHGKSNLEIARELAISHKTVEKHLASAYAKLGFSSRAQLAAHVGATARTP
jgi:DNA-binding CsgD family transcriptional regulator/tetratricopeptide (TPR) repeat protein